MKSSPGWTAVSANTERRRRGARTFLPPNNQLPALHRTRAGRRRASACGRPSGSAYTPRGVEATDPPLSPFNKKKINGEIRMNEQASSGGVSYKQVGADYFEKRGLRRYAKVWSLW